VNRVEIETHLEKKMKMFPWKPILLYTVVAMVLAGCEGGTSLLSDSNNSAVLTETTTPETTPQSPIVEESNTSTTEEDSTSESSSDVWIVPTTNDGLPQTQEIPTEENLTTTIDVPQSVTSSDENLSDEQSVTVIDENTSDDNNTTSEEANLTEDDNSTIEGIEALYGKLQKGIGIDGAYPFEDSEDEDKPIWMDSAELFLNANIAHDERYTSITAFDGDAFSDLQTKLQEAKYVVYWITAYWNASWFNLEGMQALLDKGYVLVFNYWYFADALDGGLPNDDQINDYYAHNEDVLSFLQQLHGEILIVMEPEFNKWSVVTNPTTQEQEDFADVLGNAIDTFKEGLADTSEVAFSLSMMDTGVRDANASYDACGYSPCSKGDLDMWKRSETIYKRLGDKLDFISFSEMLGQFSRDYEDPGSVEEPNPRSYTDEELGIDDLPDRLVNLVSYLHDTYNKPVFISHIALASATWHDDNENGQVDVNLSDDVNEVDPLGWQPEVDRFYEGLKERFEQLASNGLFGLATMKLFDNPQQDIYGYQYFLQNEYHLGIITTSAVDEVDPYLKGDIQFKGNFLQ